MKKILSVMLAALLMLCACSLTAFADEGAVVFMSYAGSDDNDGLTPETPKKAWKGFDDTGAISLLQNGGTLVASQKAYAGGSYSMPTLAGPLTITGVYNGVDYKNTEPANNPASGVFKMASGASFTINSDVIFDDIIMFQENNQNTIKIALGATLTVTDSVILMTKPGNDYHFKIVVEVGGTAILSKAAQEVFTIENLGGTVKTYGEENAPAVTEAPVVTTAAPVVTTEAPVVTTAAPVETTVAPAATTAAPVETTEAPAETTEEPVVTTAAPAATTAVPTAPAEDGGSNAGMIVGIIAAVVVVAAIAFVILKKKKN